MHFSQEISLIFFQISGKPLVSNLPTPRLEAPSDGVLAIFITIMVLELKVPHGVDLAALKSLLPEFLSYVLSFVYLGIYWNNHHHLLHAAARLFAMLDMIGG